MKRLLTFISVFALLFTACEGDPGPPGPPGFDGESALAYEIRNVNFNTDNNFEIFDEFQLLSTDVVFVYRQTNILDTGADPIWQLLPQTYFIDDAGNDLVYNYDYTQFDVIIFLDSSLQLTALGPEWTNNQTFRVVVLPTANFGSVDISNINEVMQAFNITDIQTL